MSSSLPLKQLGRQKFLGISYDTGGIPRYLQYCVRYGVKEGYKRMDEELEEQLRPLISKPDSVNNGMNSRMDHILYLEQMNW